MAIEFTVKSRFIVNGKEYGSVEEMPEEIRAAYAKAIKSSPGLDHARKLSAGFQIDSPPAFQNHSPPYSPVCVTG